MWTWAQYLFLIPDANLSKSRSQKQEDIELRNKYDYILAYSICVSVLDVTEKRSPFLFTVQLWIDESPGQDHKLPVLDLPWVDPNVRMSENQNVELLQFH